jgi:hypothetical protein
MTELRASIPSLFNDVAYDELRATMRHLFPIHKNMRRRTRLFKIRVREPLRLLDSKRIRLRPLASIPRQEVPR